MPAPMFDLNIEKQNMQAEIAQLEGKINQINARLQTNNSGGFFR